MCDIIAHKPIAKSSGSFEKNHIVVDGLLYHWSLQECILLVTPAIYRDRCYKIKVPSLIAAKADFGSLGHVEKFVKSLSIHAFSKNLCPACKEIVGAMACLSSDWYGGGPPERIFDEDDSVITRLDPSYIIGGDLIRVSSSDIVEVKMLSGRTFKPEYVLIPSPIADNFEVIDIKVNGVSQASFKNGVPARLFSEECFHKKMNMDVCQEAIPISIIVRNIASVECGFVASVIGKLIDVDQGQTQENKECIS